MELKFAPAKSYVPKKLHEMLLKLPSWQRRSRNLLRKVQQEVDAGLQVWHLYAALENVAAGRPVPEEEVLHDAKLPGLALEFFIDLTKRLGFLPPVHLAGEHARGRLWLEARREVPTSVVCDLFRGFATEWEAKQGEPT